MIRTYLIHKNELSEIPYREEMLSESRIRKIEKLKRDEDKQRSVCAELLLIYALKQQENVSLPLNVTEDDRNKLTLPDSKWHFNISHARDYAVCALSDAPVGVDLEYFRVQEPLHADRILHPEEAQLLPYISNPNEKKKYFYECWVSKESYLKNLGIGLIVRPREFLVHEDRLVIRDEEITGQKGHHDPKAKILNKDPNEKSGTLEDNLQYLEPRYVHVYEPGEIRGTDWKFDAGYRMAVCSMEKDPDSSARLIHAADINQALGI